MKKDCLVYLTYNTTPALTAHPARGAFGIQSNICGGPFLCGNNQRIKTVGYNRRRAPLRMFDSILNATLLNNSLHLHQKMVIPRMFPNIPRNI